MYCQGSGSTCDYVISKMLLLLSLIEYYHPLSQRPAVHSSTLLSSHPFQKRVEMLLGCASVAQRGEDGQETKSPYRWRARMTAARVRTLRVAEGARTEVRDSWEGGTAPHADLPGLAEQGLSRTLARLVTVLLEESVSPCPPIPPIAPDVLSFRTPPAQKRLGEPHNRRETGQLWGPGRAGPPLPEPRAGPGSCRDK